MKKIIYTGTLSECGLRGPVTGARYLARRGQVFEVDEADSAALLRRYPDVLEEVAPPPRRRRAEIKDEPSGEDGDGEVGDGPFDDGDAPVA